MKKLHIKNIAFILVILIMTTLFSSCSKDDGSGYIFRTNIESNPQNLDPQMASDEASKMIIMNTYDGLVRMTPDGTIENAACESYSLSDNGLTYTFKLKDNIFWEGLGDFTAKLTADDFVYAFERILSKNSTSPYSKEFTCIKNANAIKNGAADISILGIKAKDELTLEIELEYPYYNFLEMLTHTAAMPCNKEFFVSTKGRYGLSAETSISNSAFYIKEWNFDPYWDNNYIILRRNTLNHEQNMVYPYSVNFFITGDSSGDIDSYNADKTDCVVTSSYNKKLIENNKYQTYQSNTYGLVFNPKSENINSAELRYALAASVDREQLKVNLTEDLSIAYGIVPPSVSICGKHFRNISADTALSVYNLDKAVSAWKKELASRDLVTIDGIKITVPDSFSSKNVISDLTEQWQTNLDFFCGIEVVSEKEYKSKLAEGNYEIALVELNADYNEPSEFINYFKNGSKKNFNGYINPTLEGKYTQLNTCKKLSDAADLIEDMESLVINDMAFVPLFYGNEYFVYSKDADDLIYYPFTRQIVFRDAKMY